MNFKQKLLKTTLLLFLLGLLAPFFVLFGSSKAAAAPKTCEEKGYYACANQEIWDAIPRPFKMTADKTKVTSTFAPAWGPAAGVEVPFIDGQVNDSNHRYDAPPGTFCSGGNGIGTIQVTPEDYAAISSSSIIPGTLDVDWYNQADGSCEGFQGPKGCGPTTFPCTGELNTTGVIIDVSAASGVTTGSNCDGGPGCVSNKCVHPELGCTDSSLASSSSQNEACFASSWEWSWAVCPIISAAQTSANAMYGFVEDQLKFTVLQSCPSPTTASNCPDSLAASHGNVHDAWNNFRILVSSIVVILLLVMVISQAIGSGPFDPYTVRKMLPRLVLGVILIQISWPVFAYTINVVDRLGIGLADLMYAPFGGASKMDLYSLLSPFGTEAVAFNWVGLGALVIFGVMAPFIVLGMILAVLLALFAGFLTLLFRKILIILALIFVPVALISWMMPSDGLRQYWKLWWSNFSKALMMFPLIIAIIAAGRIFAKIGSAQNDFVGFFIVLIGFFGPLFILPKTFKWGGTVMAQAGNGLSKLQGVADKKQKEVWKGFNERYQGKGAKDYNPQAGKFSKAYRRVRSGHFLPTERSRRLTIAAGNAWADERNKEAEAYTQRSQEKALAGYNKFDIDDQGRYVRFARNAAGKLIDAAGNEVADERLAHIAQVYGTGKAGKKAALTAGEGVGYKKLTGVEAGKQALVDIAGNDGSSVTSKRAAQAAVKQLIDTHSEIELQKSRIQGGKNAGRRANEVHMWREAITNSPPHYSAINSSRPDFAPDIIESAVSRAVRVGDVAAGTKYEEASAADRRLIDKHRMSITLERMTPEQMAQAHYGLYNDIEAVGGETVTYKDETGADVTSTVAEQLASTIDRFKHSGTTVGLNAVGSLKGGKEVHVNRALATTHQTIDTI